MQRVLVIGSPGSGKSTLARELATLVDLPLVHLDQMYWRPNWVEPEEAEWREQLVMVLAQPSWVMDGNYDGTLRLRLEAADTVVLLDLPTWLCLFRIVKRVVMGRGRIRPDMAAGCPERFHASFLVYVWRFRRRKLPGVVASLREFPGKVLILRSRGEVSRLLDSLRAVRRGFERL